MNTASTAGLFPYGYDRLPYVATKHAIVGLSESLAVYLRPKGIGVSCFCPAGVITNIVEQMTFYGERTQPIGPNFGVVDAILRAARRGRRRQRPVPDPHHRRGARTSCEPAAMTSRPISTRSSRNHVTAPTSSASAAKGHPMELLSTRA